MTLSQPRLDVQGRRLVVIPCGAAKVWDRHPDAGAVPAEFAYTGSPFKVNRGYARAAGGPWAILSAKYGLLWPDTVIPGPYEVSFTRPSSGPLSQQALNEQIDTLGLPDLAAISALGGRAYLDRLAAAFAGHPGFTAPWRGLGLGYGMQAVKRATLALERAAGQRDGNHAVRSAVLAGATDSPSQSGGG